MNFKRQVLCRLMSFQQFLFLKTNFKGFSEVSKINKIALTLFSVINVEFLQSVCKHDTLLTVSCDIPLAVSVTNPGQN